MQSDAECTCRIDLVRDDEIIERVSEKDASISCGVIRSVFTLSSLVSSCDAHSLFVLCPNKSNFTRSCFSLFRPLARSFTLLAKAKRGNGFLGRFRTPTRQTPRDKSSAGNTKEVFPRISVSSSRTLSLTQFYVRDSVSQSQRNDKNDKNNNNNY